MKNNKNKGNVPHLPETYTIGGDKFFKSKSMCEYIGQMIEKENRMKRKEILSTAADIVTKDRNQQYGEPEDNFENIAALWSDYLDKTIDARDVGNMMILFKIARAQQTGGTLDTYIDIAGYAACTGEIIAKDER